MKYGEWSNIVVCAVVVLFSFRYQLLIGHQIRKNDLREQVGFQSWALACWTSAWITWLLLFLSGICSDNAILTSPHTSLILSDINSVLFLATFIFSVVAGRLRRTIPVGRWLSVSPSSSWRC